MNAEKPPITFTPEGIIAGRGRHCAPHWCEAVEWRDGRWDPISNAPKTGDILWIRGRRADGTTVEPIHYACGGGDEQPPFDGWFAPYKPNHDGGYYEVQVVEWQPLRAKPEAA